MEDDVSNGMLMDFENALLNVYNSILHAPILATNFYNDKEILDIMCQEVVIGLKKKNQKKYLKNLI